VAKISGMWTVSYQSLKSEGEMAVGLVMAEETQRMPGVGILDEKGWVKLVLEEILDLARVCCF